MKAMQYRGYHAHIEYSDEDELFVGRIASIHDVVGFHGESVQALRTAFQEAVDDYIETCHRLKRPLQKPWSGKLSLRLAPELHARAALQAELANKSLNQWVSDLIGERALQA